MINDKSELDYDLLEDDEDAQKDKYITFFLADEEYAIEILYVTEIIGIQKITHLPDMPHYLKGIINLRGKVIPIIDMRLRFNLAETEYGNRTCIIVVSFNELSCGLIVDEVSEVLDIPKDSIEPPPQTIKGSNSRYIQGIGKVADKVKIILSVDKVLSEEDISVMMETV